MAIRLENASLYLVKSIEHWAGEEDTQKQQDRGREQGWGWCRRWEESESLKLFGGVLEKEAKREVAVRVGEDTISTLAITSFCVHTTKPGGSGK